MIGRMQRCVAKMLAVRLPDVMCIRLAHTDKSETRAIGPFFSLVLRLSVTAAWNLAMERILATALGQAEGEPFLHR